MKPLSFFRFWLLGAAPLFLWSIAATQDADESNSQANSFGDRNQVMQNYTSPISSSQSDLIPYVGDAPLVDSLYVVGPGDLFQISFEASSVEKQVNPEGNIILNRIGIIHVGGLTLKAAETRILDYLQTAYRRSNCFVNLRRPKTIRVFITGAVNLPGIYQLPGNFRLSDALNMAGNFSVLAQRQDIQIQSGDSIRIGNIQKFMSMGDLSFNPYLTQGCIIKVPFIDYDKPWVTVARDSETFVIQMNPGENAQDLMLSSYSFAFPATYSALLVREKGRKDSLLTPSEAAHYKPLPEARIEVLSSREQVFVAGAVAKPGFLSYRSDHQIIQYISEAGLSTASKISDKLEVIHKNGQRETLPLEATLQPGDVVYVDQNTQQIFLIYTPILLSIVSLTLALLTLRGN